MRNKINQSRDLFLRFLGVSILCLCLTMTAFAQVTINVKNEPIRQILKTIEKKTSYKFFFNDDFTALNKVTSLNVKNVTIDNALGILFAESEISWEKREKNLIVLILKKTSLDEKKPNKSVSGIVTDLKGEPVIGANVMIHGTKNGTITDLNGRFSMTVSENTILSFSYIGYLPQERYVGESSNLIVKLQENNKQLDEIIVVGYGTQKKVNMTGAVSSVKFDEMASTRPIVNVSSALAGLSSGVTVIQGSGKPGSDGSTIRIRGIGTLNNSDPLIIVDGMEGSLDVLNPQDIESISILKDAASSSIYGSRAANGVILVTTKKGNNKRLSVAYNGVFSVAQPTNLLNAVTDYPTYMRLMNESAVNYGTTAPYSQSTISAWETANKNPNGLNSNGVPNYVVYPNTDWNKEMYKTKLIKDQSVSVNGATENARFLLSAGYLDNPGLVDYTGLKRYTFRSNVEIDINKWLTVGTRTYGSLFDTEMGDYSTMLTYMMATTPGVYPIYNGKYGYPEAPGESTTVNNLDAVLHNYIGNNTSSRINTTAYSKATLAKGLSWEFNLNYSKQVDEVNYHTNPQSAERVMFSTGATIVSPIAPEKLITYYSAASNYRYTLENLLRYQTTIAGKHHFNGLLGYNETYYYAQNFNSTKQGLVDETVSVPSAATTLLSSTGTAGDWALRSWFGRVNYDYDSRYLLEANLRYDGSSRFAPSSRYGYFPSFSAGWRISEEEFLKNLNLFQNLKLRASWGKLGNNASGNYDYQSLYSTTNYSFNGVQTAGLYSAKIANPYLQWESTTVANSGLDASMFNGHLTAEVDVYNKVTDGILTTPPISITMGVVSAPTMNSAEVTNKGVEITLGWKDKIGEIHYSITGNIGYNDNEVTGYKGKLNTGWSTDLSGNPLYTSNLGDVATPNSSTSPTTYVVEGHPINEYYLLPLYKGSGSYFNRDGSVNISGGPKDGMIRTTKDMAWLNAMVAAGYKFMPNQTISKTGIWYGDYIYADTNGDKIYGNSYDRKFSGSTAMPKFTFGAQMNLSWKDLDLNMIWSGQAGGQLYWNEQGYNSTSTRLGYQISEMVANSHYYYDETNPTNPLNNLNATYPRLKYSQTDTQNNVASMRWLYDASFVRLKSLTLGYTLPKKVAQRINTQQLRFYVSAENLLTITSYPGLDPEIGGGNTNYPLSKLYSFGVNVTF